MNIILYITFALCVPSCVLSYLATSGFNKKRLSISTDSYTAKFLKLINLAHQITFILNVVCLASCIIRFQAPRQPFINWPSATISVVFFALMLALSIILWVAQRLIK